RRPDRPLREAGRGELPGNASASVACAPGPHGRARGGKIVEQAPLLERGDRLADRFARESPLLQGACQLRPAASANRQEPDGPLARRGGGLGLRGRTGTPARLNSAYRLRPAVPGGCLLKSNGESS